jgi:hypothetical protein
VIKNTKQIPLFKDIFDKTVELDFNGGDLSSDSGLILLRQVEQKLGIIKRIADVVPDDRHQSYIDHDLWHLISQRVFQIAAGYEDGNDCDSLRNDPILKMVCDKKPQSDSPLASQPTMSRFENSLSSKDLYRIADAILAHFIASYNKPPKAILLDLDDTDDPTHGRQQLSLFNNWYHEYCYQPMHIYEGQSGKLVASILRPGKRPSGKEIVMILKRIVNRLRDAWPTVDIVIRGDSHYSSAAIYEYCDQHNIKFILGLTGYKTLLEKVSETCRQAEELYQLKNEPIKLYSEFDYQASSWSKAFRVVAKIEYNDKGSNIRFIITNIETMPRRHLYEIAYCGRGAMELMIKDHKNHLLSDRLSCSDFGANQFRLFLHSIAYIFMHAMRDKMLQNTAYARCQFDTLRIVFFKVSARIIEMKTKIKIHITGSYPLKDEFTRILISGFS